MERLAAEQKQLKTLIMHDKKDSELKNNVLSIFLYVSISRTSHKATDTRSR